MTKPSSISFILPLGDLLGGLYLVALNWIWARHDDGTRHIAFGVTWKRRR